MKGLSELIASTGNKRGATKRRTKMKGSFLDRKRGRKEPDENTEEKHRRRTCSSSIIKALSCGSLIPADNFQPTLSAQSIIK